MLDEPRPNLLRRSLLWCRGADTPTLRPIDFSGSRHPPPTWSWMAHQGGIDYLDVPEGKVEWQVHDIVSPWTRTGKAGTWYSLDEAEPAEIEVVVRGFELDPASTTTDEVHLVFDEPNSSAAPPHSMKCVILGKMNIPMGPDGRARYEKCCVLLVVRSVQKASSKGPVYERVGAGWISADLVVRDSKEAGILQ